MSSTLVVAVVEALSHAEGISPDELDYSLYEYIDPDVLPCLDNQPNTDWELSFEVPDHEVCVTGEGIIMVDGVRFDANRPFS